MDKEKKRIDKLGKILDDYKDRREPEPLESLLIAKMIEFDAENIIDALKKINVNYKSVACSKRPFGSPEIMKCPQCLGYEIHCKDKHYNSGEWFSSLK